jgi:hypothetical protein
MAFAIRRFCCRFCNRRGTSDHFDFLPFGEGVFASAENNRRFLATAWIQAHFLFGYAPAFGRCALSFRGQLRSASPYDCISNRLINFRIRASIENLIKYRVIYETNFFRKPHGKRPNVKLILNLKHQSAHLNVAGL